MPKRKKVDWDKIRDESSRFDQSEWNQHLRMGAEDEFEDWLARNGAGSEDEAEE